MALILYPRKDNIPRMSKAVSSVADVLKALPAVQRAVRKEIQARIDAGEKIASIEDPEMRAPAVLERAGASRAPKKSAA